jgi:glycosyltransferase involved in cell wall biosynthesis
MDTPEIKISFLIPLFNEETVFPLLINRLNSFSNTLSITHEIILVDDGSTDKTAELMQALAINAPKYHCIFLSRNFGHQFAVSAGLTYSRGTEALMILDGDLQDPPEVFESFYACLKEGYDVVYGIRTKRKENEFKKISYYFFYRILSRISSSPIFLDSGDFSLLSRRVVNIINEMPENSRFLRGMRGWIGFKQKGVAYERDVRAAGEPKYTLTKLFKLAYDGIFNFSAFPIKFLTWSGVFCLATSFIYFLFTMYKKFFENDVPTGFTALLFMIIFFGGIQLVSIGIIGEYVSRTFEQVKNRPLFIIKSRIQNGSVVS